MRNKRAIIFAATIFIVYAAAMPARAQEFGRIDNLINTGTAYFAFAQPGEATVQVIVLGSVGAPGVYEIGISVDLGQLLALAGGPPLTETTGITRTTSETTARLFRVSTGRRDLVYEAPLDLLLREPDLYPSLQDGDVFTIETVTHTKTRFGWRDALSLVTTGLTVAILIDRLSN